MLGIVWMAEVKHGGRLFRILAPATYIFFASVIPALAFGEQLYRYTGGERNRASIKILTTTHCRIPSLGADVHSPCADGLLSGVQVLFATGLTGILQVSLPAQRPCLP